jgi:hypothetical protein
MTTDPAPDTNPWAGRQTFTRHFEGMFRFDHLGDGDLRALSLSFRQQAEIMLRLCHDGPELTAALRHLWDAKNNAVMQLVIDKREAGSPPPANKPGII